MGGSEKQLLRVVNELKKNYYKYQVIIVARKAKNDLSFEKVSPKIKIYRLFSTEIPILSMMLFMISLPIFLIHYHLRFRISVIHLQLPDFFLLSLLLVRYITKIPIITRIAANELNLITFHGIWYNARRFMRSLILQTDAIHTLNPTAFNNSFELGFSVKNLYLIPNGVNVPVDSKNYKSLKRQILYVGAMRNFPKKMNKEQKNLKYLIKAFSLLIKYEPDIKLLMIGDGNYKRILENFVNENKEIKGKVFFYGYHSKIIPFYRECDILINPSYFEGLPNVVIEAMAYGMYVLCSSIPAHQFLIGGNNLYGDMFNHENINDLVNKIIKFYEEPDIFIKKATNARNLIIKKFSISIIVKKLLLMYKKVTSNIKIDPS